MGWLVLISLAAIVAASCYWVARIRGAALALVVIALSLAMLGYSWQGHPSLASAPAVALRDTGPPDADVMRANPLKPAFTREDMAINTAEALVRAHNSAGAVSLLKSELATEPGNPALWNALGKAFVAHGDGLVSPAALIAFDRAAALDPRSSTPPMMHALALAQGGRLDESARMIQSLLARLPQNDPERPEIERKLAEVRARIAGQ